MIKSDLNSYLLIEMGASVPLYLSIKYRKFSENAKTVANVRDQS